jgi:hypothetical protein
MSDDHRVATVSEHMRLKNGHDFAGSMGDCTRAKYEVIADGGLFDGSDRVNAFLDDPVQAFSDSTSIPMRVSPAIDAVLVEGRFAGRHLGSWRKLRPPPSASTSRCA